jgi:predicted KAP-like P-loop ATPase
MNTDNPILDKKDDAFNYYPLAEQLAPHLLLKRGAPSLIAGVEAPWGSGKTSFLNLIRRAIEALRPEVVVLEYSPWIYSTADSLILGFCV